MHLINDFQVAYRQMIEEPHSACTSCGVGLPNAQIADGHGLCPVCASQDETPQAEPSIQDTIVPSDRRRSELIEQTLPLRNQSTSDASNSPRKPAVIPANIGRFEIKSLLGKGGFGTVYRAYDPLLDREVALKVPRLIDDDHGNYTRFLREAKAAARLRHPNIVAVFECGIADDKPYIASEFVDGTPLSEILKSGKLTIRRAVDLVEQIAEAIDYAHSEGIVHRDLKPANIMVSKSGRPQVMDFGLAKLNSDTELSLMSEGAIVGTPAYMAPEQARGDKDAVGPKSDQYSVGVLLYVMLCGTTPYLGDSWSIISRVADPVIQPQTPRTISSSIPRDLEACCLKAIEKDQRRRYDSLSALAEDLANWLQGRPLLARPIGPRERFVRWCSRNRLIAGLLATITMFILAALIVGYLLAFNFSNLANYANERAEAEENAKRDVERLLIDTFTESGLQAGRNGRDQEAVLWFGSAAERASEYPRRERMNRTRFQTWLTNTPIPVRMFPGLQRWHRSLSVHASGKFVLSEQNGPEGEDTQIWHVASGDLWTLPWNARVQAAAWNTEGTLLALASGAEVRVFRFPDGEEVDRWQHGDRVNQLLFSVDDRKVAVGGAASTVVRELSKESPFKVIRTPASVARMAWSPSGNILATLCGDHHVHVWNGDPAASDDQPITTALSCPFNSEPPQVQFLSEKLLVVPESGKAITCWDVSNGQSVWSVPCGTGASFTSSADRSRLAITNRENLLQIDARTGETLGPTMTHPNLVYCAAFDSSGEQLLSGCGDQIARIFSTETGELVSSMLHSDIVHRVAWFPGDKACVTVHWKADLVRVWKLGITSEAGFTSELPAGVMHVKWSDDGRWFIPTGMDLMRGVGPCRVLNTFDGTPAGAPISFPGRVSDACFIKGRHHVFMAGSAVVDQTLPKPDRYSEQDLSGSGLIVGVNVDSGEQLFPPIETASNVVALEASLDGRIVAALCHDHELLIIDSESGKILHRHNTFPDIEFFYGYVIFRRIAFSPKGDRFALWGSRSRTAEIRNVVDGTLLYTVAHTNDTNLDWLHNLTFSPDGKVIATCSADQTVQLWNAENGEQLPLKLPHTGWVFSAEFSQDGKRLLTSCSDRQARLWNLDDADDPLLIATPPQNDEVYATCFLPGEDVFLIGLRNGEVSAWDAHHGKSITPASIEPGQQATYTIELSPDQSRVMIISRDAKVRSFHPSRWQPVIENAFSPHELRLLGEMIASQELHDGVLIGLTNESIMGRWRQLYASHSEHPIFRWPE